MYSIPDSACNSPISHESLKDTTCTRTSPIQSMSCSTALGRQTICEDGGRTKNARPTVPGVLYDLEHDDLVCRQPAGLDDTRLGNLWLSAVDHDCQALFSTTAGDVEKPTRT